MFDGGASSREGCPAAVRSWRATWGIDEFVSGVFAIARRASGAVADDASLLPPFSDVGHVDGELLRARGAAAERTAPAAPAADRGTDVATGKPLWTAIDLARYTGADAGRARVVLGVCGDVFDVTTKGYHFYGPGGSYHLFAGRDATRALVLGTTDDSDVAREGDVSDVEPSLLEETCTFYRGKYELIGKIALVERRAQPSVHDSAQVAAAPEL